MKHDFFIPIQITNNVIVNCKEIKNKDYFTLLKYLQNQDFNNLTITFEELILTSLQNKEIYDTLTIIDKAIILLTLRSVCISPEITLESKKLQKIVKKININNIIKKLQNIKYNHSIKINEKLTLNLTLPKKLTYSSLDEVIESCIYSITNDHEKKILKQEEVKDVLSLLPGHFFFELKKFTEQIEENLTKIVLIEDDETFKIKSINCSIFSNNIFNFMLSVFSDSLLNFYNLIYIFGTKLNLSKTDFDELTPAESTLLTNLYIREQEEITKASKQPKTQNIGAIVDK